MAAGEELRVFVGALRTETVKALDPRVQETHEVQVPVNIIGDSDSDLGSHVAMTVRGPRTPPSLPELDADSVDQQMVDDGAAVIRVKGKGGHESMTASQRYVTAAGSETRSAQRRTLSITLLWNYPVQALFDRPSIAKPKTVQMGFV